MTLPIPYPKVGRSIKTRIIHASGLSTILKNNIDLLCATYRLDGGNIGMKIITVSGLITTIMKPRCFGKSLCGLCLKAGRGGGILPERSISITLIQSQALGNPLIIGGGQRSQRGLTVENVSHDIF
jgi:hypothetical protein